MFTNHDQKTGTEGYHPRQEPQYPASLTAKVLESIFEECDDFQTRRIETGELGRVTVTVCWLDGLTSGNDISEERLRLIEKKRAEVLDDCLHTAEELLKSNIDLVNKYIEELTDKYTLTHEEIMAIYNQMRPEAA